jgi:menaquinone-specific isochorismate synthase
LPNAVPDPHLNLDLVSRELTSQERAGITAEDVCGDDGYLFARGGRSRAGRGILARVPLADIDTVRRSVIGGGADAATIARTTMFCAVDFDGSSGDVVLPHTTVGVDEDGTAWVVHPRGSEPDLAAARSDTTGRSEFTVQPGVDVDTYLAAVTAARDAVRAGHVTKAVIARDVIVTSSQAIDIVALAKRMRRAFGSSYRYVFDGLVGASPELLVEREGDVVRSHPLAGTTGRTGDPTVDARLAAELLASEKNQLEHRVVIDMVHDTLLPWCSYLDWQPEPEVVPVANVQHLGTRVEGRLGDPAPHVIELVRALVPTPALGGHPRAAALDLIARVEGFTRGRYGGAVGWMDALGNGTFAVTIRCASIDASRRTARLFAGGGIVAASEPLAELEETRAKFQAMLSMLVRP